MTGNDPTKQAVSPAPLPLHELPPEVLARILEYLFYSIIKDNPDHSTTYKEVLKNFGAVMRVNRLLKQKTMDFFLGIKNYHNIKRASIPNYQMTPLSLYHIFVLGILITSYTMARKHDAKKETEFLFYLAVRLRGEQNEPQVHKFIAKFFYGTVQFYNKIISQCLHSNLTLFHAEFGDLAVYLSQKNIMQLFESQVISFSDLVRFTSHYDLKASKSDYLSLRTTMNLLAILANNLTKVQDQKGIIPKIDCYLQQTLEKDFSMNDVVAKIQEFISTYPKSAPVVDSIKPTSFPFN